MWILSEDQRYGTEPEFYDAESVSHNRKKRIYRKRRIRLYIKKHS